MDVGLQLAKAALRLDPEEAYGHFAEGFALMFLRRFREAEISLDHAVALNPNDPLILSIRALLLNYVGRYDAALAELEQAQRRDPFAVGWLEESHGIILTNLGRYREALASFDRISTPSSWARVYMAICNAELGETHLAETALARIKTAYPQFPGITLEEILELEVFHQDPTVVERYRASLARIEKSGQAPAASS